MIRKSRTESEDTVRVTFEIPGSVWAERINLVGDFNGWDRDNLPFTLDRDGNWVVELDLQRGRQYRFRYLINGDYWGYDWHADKHTPRPDGQSDSILIL
jgi:1,4-alpha-glucan branching enzyme